MAGQFTQEIISPEGEVLEQSSGSFGLLRPHFFRWEILTPDSQLLLADGEILTQIDWDLEVVVERPIPETASSPFQWLLASRANWILRLIFPCLAMLRCSFLWTRSLPTDASTSHKCPTRCGGLMLKTEEGKCCELSSARTSTAGLRLRILSRLLRHSKGESGA
jgi:hypothetical protein